MANITKVLENEELVRWRLVKMPAHGARTEEVGVWQDEPPYAQDVKQLAEDWGDGRYKLLSYFPKSRPGPTHSWTVVPDNEKKEAESERAAVAALVDMASHIRKMHADSVRSWEMLARDQLKAVNRLQGEQAELRENLAFAGESWAQAVDSIGGMLAENPQLASAAFQGLGTAVASVGSLLKAPSGQREPKNKQGQG